MKPLGFDDLARLPLVVFYQDSFHKATGVALKVVPPEGAALEESDSLDNAFCALLACAPASCVPCQDTERRACAAAAKKLSTQQLYCYAGLTVLAVPVLAGGRHIATLLSGQVFRREPTERDFGMILKQLGGGLSAEWVRKTRRAYFETPVLTAERFHAAVQLLEVFAQYLADSAGKLSIAGAHTEPEAVARAKEFIQANAEEGITLTQVVEHVHVSRFHFCKIFKKATGLTLTEYVMRVRVEKAKALLNDPARRISEIVFASGFGSIPRFNSVFKQHVGMAPSEYRASLRVQFPNSSPKEG